MTNLPSELYNYAGGLFLGGNATDAKIDWYSDTIKFALVATSGTSVFAFDPTDKYFSDVSAYEIPAAGSYAAGGILLNTIAPTIDLSDAPTFTYAALTASSTASKQAPVFGSATNGLKYQIITMLGMVGGVAYKYVGSDNTKNPLIGYVDLSAGALQSLLVNGSPHNTAGQSIVQVVSTSHFAENQSVLIKDSAHAEANVVSAVTSGTLLTMTSPLSYSYTSANSGFCLSANNATSAQYEILFDPLGMFRVQINASA